MDVFHPGERAAQAQAGFVLPTAPIRPEMPDQQRLFIAGLPLLFMAVADADGWPVATAVAGAPGFLSSPDAGTLRVAAALDPADPAAAGLCDGGATGLLGIDLATRRRSRLNGTLHDVGSAGFSVAVRQSFGNCPKYIQMRQVAPAPAVAPGPVQRLAGLDAAARAVIAGADTCFVASGSGPGGGAAGGLDISHRGGPPGFVQVDGDVLLVPDYRGNRYFNTLGNLLLDPRAALLFVDFQTGGLLQLQGRAAVEWVPGALPGAERQWSLAVTAGWRRPAALPLRWTPMDDRRAV